jgi:hypothetical protein
MAGVFAPYSVASAVYLTMDRPGLSVLARKSEISVPPTNKGIRATCGDAGGAWDVDDASTIRRSSSRHPSPEDSVRSP